MVSWRQSINEEFTVPVQSPSFQVSVAVGCATRDRTVAFASTFATFFTRAFDQIRMAAISESNINLCGSHCGVSIGKLPVWLGKNRLFSHCTRYGGI